MFGLQVATLQANSSLSDKYRPQQVLCPGPAADAKALNVIFRATTDTRLVARKLKRLLTREAAASLLETTASEALARAGMKNGRQYEDTVAPAVSGKPQLSSTFESEP